VPKCLSGHDVVGSLKCPICGSATLYKESLAGLVELPVVNPDFGKTAILYAGVAPLDIKCDFAASIKSAETKNVRFDGFEVEKIAGGTWHDLYSAHSQEVTKWLRLIAFAKSRYKILVIDGADPLSVLAAASLPQGERTVVVAIGADQGSTKVQQNCSYVALSTALKRGFQVLVFPQAVVREGIAVDETGTLRVGMEALALTIEKVLTVPDNLVDLLEGDKRFGINLHATSSLTLGSKRMYGTIANAVVAESFQVPEGLDADLVKSVHSIIFCERSAEQDFEKAFSQYRRSTYTSAISSECRFVGRENPGTFEILTIYGMSDPVVLRASAQGYEEISKGQAKLSLEGIP
jgi:hypothetical protein